MYLAIIVLPILGSIVSGFFGRKVGVIGARLVKLFNSIKWILNSPPKPYAFVGLPLQSKVSPFTTTTLSKNVAVKTEVNTKETLINNKVLGYTSQSASDKSIIKNESLEKIHKDTFFEDEILENTQGLRNGEILDKKSINKPFYNTENQQTHHLEKGPVCDDPFEDKFPACDIESDLTETSSMETQICNKMAHLTRILEELDNSGSFLDEGEKMSIMLEISNLWLLLFLLIMLIVGLLTIIINLLKKAKIKYLSKLLNKIKYINLTKSLAFYSLKAKIVKISIKSVYNLELTESLKNAINIMNNAIDFHKVIKYIAKKFDVNNKNKNLVSTSNHMSFSHALNFLDKVKSIDKRDFIIENMARYSSNIIVYTNFTNYTMDGDSNSNLHISFVERHIRFNFNRQNDTNNVLIIGRYIDYLARTRSLLDLLFSYASVRDIAYAYQYIIYYSTNSRLSSEKVSLYNVHKLMWLTKQLGTDYPNDISSFNLAGLVQQIHLHEELILNLSMDVQARYEHIENIISIMENIIKRLRPPAIIFEFRFIGIENTPDVDVRQHCLEHYRNYAA